MGQALRITNGVSSTCFAPNATCTRAQSVTFLWNAAGKPEPSSLTVPFTDVSADAYYYKALCWAVERKITNGTSGTTFSPNGIVTRAQAVTMMWRAAGSPEVAADQTFTDVPANAYYAAAVRWAAANKITTGTGNNWLFARGPLHSRADRDAFVQSTACMICRDRPAEREGEAAHRSAECTNNIHIIFFQEVMTNP